MLSGIAAASASAGFDRRCFDRVLWRVAEKGYLLDIGFALFDPDDIPERLDKLSELVGGTTARSMILALPIRCLSHGTAQPDLRGNRKMGTGMVGEIIDDLKRLRDHGYRSTIFAIPYSISPNRTASSTFWRIKIMTKI